VAAPSLGCTAILSFSSVPPTPHSIPIYFVFWTIVVALGHPNCRWPEPGTSLYLFATGVRAWTTPGPEVHVVRFLLPSESMEDPLSI